MAAFQFVETLLLIATVAYAVRLARPATAPYGRRIVTIGLLLALEVGALHGFAALEGRTQWGVTIANPPGLAFLTQALRAVLMLAAVISWLGLARGDLRGWQVAIVALGTLALGWGPAPAPFLAAFALAFLFNWMKWIESVNGWRRGLALAASVALLAGLSLVPAMLVSDGTARLHLTLAPTPWPPPLVAGQLTAAAARELALIRPLDRLVQALIDLMRVQLLVAVFKLLFMPVRLENMSLQRRFTINHFLVHTIPTVLTWVILAGVAYLALGFHRLDRIRDEFERTLARAGTVAEALVADAAPLGAAPEAARLAAAARWMGDDGANARIVARSPAFAAAEVAGDSAFARGLIVAGDSLWLAARRPLPDGGAIEVLVPLDRAYVDRIMRPIGGDLTVRSDRRLYSGGAGIRFTGGSPWSGRPTIESAQDAGRPRWFLGRTYVPVGDWSRAARRADHGAIELGLATTPGSLMRSLVASMGGLYASLPTLFILLVALQAFSMIQGFAVRSGRSIMKAVVEEAATLRTAAERFGAGDLDYRLPVRKDRNEFSVVAASFNEMAANLSRQREELVAVERLEEDLAVARQIQQRFLPQRAPELSGLDVAGASRPSREVGGDLFYWFPHEDGSLGFTLGDVSGKSVPAALLMSNVLAGLRSQALLRVEPAESLDRVNRFLVDQIEPGRFVTLFYGEADPARGTLRYASAGHNPPLLLRADGRLEWLREGGVPLGVLPETPYAATGLDFGPGDTLLVYSDGVSEAEAPSDPAAGGAAAPPLFGEERIAAVARSQRGKSAHETIEAVLEAVRVFANGAPQADDITVLVVRRV